MKHQIIILTLLVIIVILVICLCKRKDNITCESGCDHKVTAFPKCLSDANCDQKETCSHGYCMKTDCANCSLDLLPTFDPFPGSFTTQVWTVRAQSNGQILCTNSTSRVMRYNSNGTVDMTFGVGGVLSPPSFNSVRVANDDSIFVLSNGIPGTIRKYTPNGSGLDLTFGVAGVFSLPAGNATLLCSKEQSDGSIIFNYTISNVLYVGRLTSLGVIDPTFGVAGYTNVSTLIVGTPFYDIREFNVLADDSIILAGSLGASNSDVRFGSVKLNANGALDVTYGSGGICVVPIAAMGEQSDVCNDVYAFGSTYLPDGTAFVHGYASTRDFSTSCVDFYPFTMVRITPAGVFDLTYGENGIFAFADSSIGYYENYHSNAVLPCDGGQIVALQRYDENDGTYLIKVTPDGKLDPTFSVITGIDNDDYFWMPLYNNGRVYMGGMRFGTPLLWVFECGQ